MRQPLLRRMGNEGFTLVEVLAAFVVLALFTVAIQRGVVTAAWSTARGDERVAAEAVAATLLDGPLSGPGGAPLPASGILNGFGWTMRLEPLPPGRFGVGLSSGTADWTPVRVTVEVRSSPGQAAAATRGEIIRLVRATP